MNLKQKGFITAGISVFLLLSTPFLSHFWIRGVTAKQIYENAENTPKKEVTLVLGAAAYNPHSLSPALQDRMDTAIELFEAGKTQKLILSGAQNEVEAMMNYAEKKGIPKNALTEDPKGFNTLASIQNIPKEAHELIIVTQKFHLPRALFYAQHAGLEAVGTIADKREYTKIFDFKKRELLTNTKAVFDVFITADFNELVRDY